MSDGLDLTVIEHKCGFKQSFAVTGRAGAHYLYAFGKLFFYVRYG